MNQKENY